MSHRNIAWLVAILAVGVVGWLVFGIVWGLLATAATLIVSEVIERRARAQRRSTRDSA